MSFYITLPSDSSIEFYPGNTMSHFYTKLPKRLELSGEWEVGLVEMIYPRMWNNIIDGENSFEYDLGNGVKIDGKIACGFYDSPIDILNAFPKHIKIQMKYNKHTKKVMVQLTNGATVKLSKGLAENLGFEPNKVIGENFIPGNGGPDTVITESPFVADPNVDLHLLYVYTDIIQPEFVGGILAPLLRTLTVKGRDGDMIQEQFERPHYLPVSRKNFDSIEIIIRTHTGRYVSFERGKLIVKLHFRLRHL